VCPTIKPFSLGGGKMAVRWLCLWLWLCLCIRVGRLQLISPHCIRFRVIAMHNSGLAVQRFVKRYNALMSRHVREIGGSQLI